MVTPVYIISHEQKVDIWSISSNLEQFMEVEKLAVYVTAYRNWTADVSKSVLGNQNIFRHSAKT